MPYSPDISETQKKRYIQRLKRASLLPMLKRRAKLLIMISNFRSGSNYVLSSLGCLPDVEVIGYDGEVLKNGKYRCYYSVNNPKSTAKQCFAFIKKTQSLHTSKYIAIKLTLEHLNHFKISIDDLCREFKSAKWIVVYRENILEQYISREKARSNNFFRWYKGSNVNESLTVDLNTNAFRSYEAEVRVFYEHLMEYAASNNHFRKNMVLVKYEDLLSDNLQPWIDKIAKEVLNVVSAPTSTPYKKQAVKPLSEVIQNYSKVKAFVESEDYLQNYQLPKKQIDSKSIPVIENGSPIVIGGMEPNLCRFMDKYMLSNGLSVPISEDMSRGTFLFRDTLESVHIDTLFSSPLRRNYVRKALDVIDGAALSKRQNRIKAVLNSIRWLFLRSAWYQKNLTHRSGVFSPEGILSFWYRTCKSILKGNSALRLSIASPISLLYLKDLIELHPNLKYVHFLNCPSDMFLIPYHHVMVKWADYLGVKLHTDTVMFAYEDAISSWCKYQQILLDLPTSFYSQNVLVIDKMNFLNDPALNLERICNFASLKSCDFNLDVHGYLQSRIDPVRGYDEGRFRSLLDKHSEYQTIKDRLLM